ncbi:hypothetical protein BWI15_00055 [Kribbella sp. ALI-6-A]|nr:hypothetical protein BWI15_00055 [Kribbella sp. ALI-6-A]
MLTTTVILALSVAGLAGLAPVIDRIFFGAAIHRAMSATSKADREHRIHVLEVAGKNRLPRPIVLQLGRQRTRGGDQGVEAPPDETPPQEGHGAT